MMNTIKLSSLDLLDVGHTIQLYGAMYSGPGGIFMIPLPDEDGNEALCQPYTLLEMSAAEWEVFLRQTDLLEMKGPAKAILRKSQRQIDQNISWAVFRRDGYACRYCGRDNVPLTVDHVILWEECGLSVEENLISSCRRCNKLRGSMQYGDWLDSPQYHTVLMTGTEYDTRIAEWRDGNNWLVLDDLPRLRSLSTAKQRSR